MILISKTYWGGAPFHFRRKPRDAQVESLVLRAADFREFRALYWTPRARPRPRTAVVVMHPRVDFTHHYCIPRLVDAGFGVLAANTRNPNNDVDTVHEEIVLDVAAAVAFVRNHRGVERVVLFGNSGGGSLMALYQAQASQPPADRIASAPCGAPTRLATADMPPADGLVFVACHRGQGHVLAQCIDPAVVDEENPLATDPALDMYDPANGFRPPPQWCEYDDTFVARYRAAQLDRVRRLDARARALIAGAADARAAVGAAGDLPDAARRRLERRAAFEPVMVVYRTMANLHYVDRHLDPSDRDYGSLLSERPDLMNYQRLGFARVVTPRAWLSTWSALSSNADLVRNIARIREPTLLAFAGRDREIYPRTDAEPIAAAAGADDQTVLRFPGARHYFEPAEPGARDAPDVDALMDAVVPWIRERFSA
ncbi:MAG: hypothetical protein D6689_16790 [Deltaproteobacteria bacterium]|nr:MAG: hypothetical protein D6689_16790 [Deltaproteobacteria bacterium]